MKKNLIFLFSLTIVTLSFSLCHAQKINTAPLDAYWKLIEPLKRGDSLSQKDWKEFLEIEPNQIYIDNQGFDSAYLERLRKTLQIVYMPKHDSLLQTRIAAIDKDPSSYWMTFKVYMYKKYEDELKKYQLEVVKTGYINKIYTNAFKWLPKRLREKDTTVNFHFLGIENDAIAGEGIIIATMWQIYIQDKLKAGILGGHEMHHVLRKGIAFENVSENEKGIMYVLNAIQNEGTADMVDKVYNVAHDEELPAGCKFKDFLLHQADSIVQQIDSSIINLAKSNGKIFQTEKDYRNLIRWTSGHCPGYYMADIIVRNGYKKELIKTIQNPFSFIYLYNKAAKKDLKKPPTFANESIEYVKLLEKKYWGAR